MPRRSGPSQSDGLGVFRTVDVRVDAKHAETVATQRSGSPRTIRRMRDPRLEKLADVLVNYSVGVKKDNVVRISAPSLAQPLIAEIYRKVIAAGGHPLLRVKSEELDE